MAENERWRYMKNVYSTLFGTPEEILDYIAVKDILLLCASGFSNRSIARRLELCQDYIENVLKEFIYSPGWDEDLDFNPWFLFKKYRNRISFFQLVKDITTLIDDESLEKAFTICKKYAIIEDIVEKYYDKQV